MICKEKARARQYRYIDSLRNRNLDLYNNKCKICSKNYDLEFAHIKNTSIHGAGRGLKNRMLDIQRNKDCYILLCKRCHRTFDSPLFSVFRITFLEQINNFNKQLN